MGVHVVDPGVWAMIKDGRLNGFSMYGQGRRVEKVIQLEIPDSGVIKGTVIKGNDQDHTHEFVVKFDQQGKFLGGETGPAVGILEDGHVHSIRKGTATEETNGHSHRFSYAESINANQLES